MKSDVVNVSHQLLTNTSNFIYNVKIIVLFFYNIKRGLYMKRKIGLCLLFSSLLFSCNNQSNNDVIYNNGEKKLDCVLGEFSEKDGVYESKRT